MRKVSVLGVILCASIPITAVFARGGGMGSSHMSVTGGAFGTSAAGLAPTHWARRFRRPASATAP